MRVSVLIAFMRVAKAGSHKNSGGNQKDHQTHDNDRK